MQHDVKATAAARRETASRMDSTLQAFKDMTPAEIDAWLQTHVTKIEEARSLLAKMLYVMAKLIP